MSKSINDHREGHGTKEWSDASYNICTGCEHNCLYCYAKNRAYRHSKEPWVPGAWKNQTLNPNRARLGAEVGQEGVVMFPTSHDITPTFLPQAVTTIKNLLARNKVLIVTKPHLCVVQALCQELAGRKVDIQFRFTIGALDQDLCAFWDQSSPPPQERLQSLQYAFNAGFYTSVSAEPMLDSVENTLKLVATVYPFVTDTIWVGKMNRCIQTINAHVPGFQAALKKIKSQQTDAEILRLVTLLSAHPKVRWKDSIKKVVAKQAARKEIRATPQVPTSEIDGTPTEGGI